MATKQAVDRLAILCALAAPPLTGCANGIPKGTLSYFLPKAQTTLTVTQTLTCNAAGDALFQVVTVNPSTVYSSDTSQPQKIIPSSISSAVSDADISFTFTDDGRLSGVNTATTGQGGAIVKSALAVAKVAGLVAAHTPRRPTRRTPASPLVFLLRNPRQTRRRLRSRSHTCAASSTTTHRLRTSS